MKIQTELSGGQKQLGESGSSDGNASESIDLR